MFQKARRNFTNSFYKPQITSTIFNLSFGEYGLICINPSSFNKKQMESIRLIATRAIRRRRVISLRMTKRRGWMKFKALYNVAITKKGSKSRMGKGKGAIDQLIYTANAYECFLEFKSVPLQTCLSLLKRISHKTGKKIALITKYGSIYKKM